MRDIKYLVENKIMDEVLEWINSGRYNPDEKLPSDYELADTYGVQRIKVRRAYEKLEEMGYIYSKQGKGRYVKDRSKPIELVLSGNQSFTEKMIEKGYQYKSVKLHCIKIEYNKKIFNELKLEKGETVYKLSRLRIVEGNPIAIHTSYIAKRNLKNFNIIESLFKLYNENGLTNFTTEKSILSIVYPTQRQRELLMCEDIMPVLKVETNCIDKETNRILDYTEIIYRMDKFKMIID